MKPKIGSNRELPLKPPSAIKNTTDSRYGSKKRNDNSSFGALSKGTPGSITNIKSETSAGIAIDTVNVQMKQDKSDILSN